VEVHSVMVIIHVWTSGNFNVFYTFFLLIFVKCDTGKCDTKEALEGLGDFKIGGQIIE